MAVSAIILGPSSILECGGANVKNTNPLFCSRSKWYKLLVLRSFTAWREISAYNTVLKNSTRLPRHTCLQEDRTLIKIKLITDHISDHKRTSQCVYIIVLQLLVNAMNACTQFSSNIWRRSSPPYLCSILRNDTDVSLLIHTRGQ